MSMFNGNSSNMKDSGSFMQGEIFWVKRKGWGNTSFGSDPKKLFRPGIVMKNNFTPTPVFMAPGTSKHHSPGNGVFVPSEINECKLSMKGCYIVRFSRPVERRFIGNFCGRISAQDRDEMIRVFKEYKKSRKMSGGRNR